MNALTNVPSSIADSRKLMIVRNTVAKDCDDMEFNTFIEYCKALELDPLRKQIYAFVFGKDDPAKRRMNVVTSIEGLRSIAARTGNYRPGKSKFTVKKDLINPDTNPIGLESATTTVYMHSHGEWHLVEATVWWDEFVPIKMDADEWEWEPIEGQFKANGDQRYRKKLLSEPKQRIDPNTQWPKMPRQMLAKVAEAHALRKAWPDNFSGLHSDDEMARARAADDEILLPSEMAEKGAVQRRQEKLGIGGKTILFDFMAGDMSPLVDVPVGKLADRIIEFMRDNKEEPSTIEAFRMKNKRGLQEFWTLAPSDYHELKIKLEKAIAGEEFE